MKRILCLVLCLVFAVGGYASPSGFGKEGLPAAWEGSWKGMTKLTWASGKIEPAEMQIQIAPIPGSAATQWKMVYKFSDRTEVRDYELKPVENSPDHFLLDEKNGFLIDTFLTNDTLYNQFTINGNLVTTRFELQDKMIAVELTMFDVRNPRLTKLTGGTFEVSAFSLKYTQRGTLKRE